MHTVTRTNVHGFQAVGWSLLPLAIGVYVLLIARHPDFRAPPAVGYALAALFLGAGLFLCTHGVAGLRRAARRETLMTLRPDEPWLADHPWNPAGIDDSPWLVAVRAFWGPFLLALFAVPAHWAAVVAHPAFFAGAVVLDLLLLSTLRAAGRLLLRAARHGASRVEFDRFPFRPGEELSVRYRGPGASNTVEATLRYIQELEQSIGEDTRRWTRIECKELWSRTQAFKSGRIRFDLPADARSTALSARPACYWELVVRAGDFETRFFLPVYRLGAGTSRRLRPQAVPRG